MKARKPAILAFAAAITAALLLLYGRYASVTRVTVMNFPDFTVEKFIRANDNPFVRIRSVSTDEPEKILCRSDMVLVRIHGTSLDRRHLDAIRKAIAKGIPVYSTESGDSLINSLPQEQLKYVDELMANGSNANYRSLFNFIRSQIDGKKLFNRPWSEAVKVPQEYYFHLGDDMFFESFDKYDQWYRSSGRYREGAPRVAFLAGNINLQNSNEEHIAALINGLESRGLNVYPISAFGPGKLEMIAKVNPDVIVNNPHGRLVMGMADAGTDLLGRLNVPVLSPLTVSEEYGKWLESRQGMAAGGMMSMSVVLPELDGAVAPFAVSAQFERDGMLLFDAIPGHTEKFCRLVERYARLHEISPADKKVAIYYYKGTGKGAVSASDIEGVQSLYNTLVLLRDNGYDVSGLPSDAAALEKMIQKQGSVLGPYAEGAYDTFLKEGNPQLVPCSTFMEWACEELPPELVGQLEQRYGKAPGKYMNATGPDGRECIAVARIRFGNIVILPQPLPAVGEDTDKLIHGTEGAPAYPYVASYLWTRKGFGADAVIHFGTHGSLEFIPGKQIALSDYDWTDALIGDVPHFYIYTIANIGEGIIAKRRSYAALVSHMTAPFMQSGLYGGYQPLKDRIHRMEILEEGEIKDNYRRSITDLAIAQKLHITLGLDSTRTFSDEEIAAIHRHIEEIDGSKVIDGLYTLGEPYTEEEVHNTARLISFDAVRYALAGLDQAYGRISREQMDDISFISHRYNATAEKIISSALSGKSPESIFAAHCPSEAAAALSAMEKARAEARKARSMQEMMGKMAAADSEDGDNSRTKSLAEAALALRDAVRGILSTRDNLRKSTAEEQAALLNALAGGYIRPGSAGDPIVNPSAVPAGRNFYSINPETTPTPEAWKAGRRLAEDLLAAELRENGRYPEKVSFTLWATDFISSEGATIAQILYLLGVEPLRDGFGYIRSLRLIPAGELGRPRIDVVVQTSGQLRDIAASRLALISRAVDMAAADESPDNYVSKGLMDSEKILLSKGFSPADARRYAKERVFGGTAGKYGTGIMGLVEKGDSWESRDEIASRYISNMSAVYSGNREADWGKEIQGVFEAALVNTSVVVQPRSGNTWGPLSLDHVYEFMGGISAAVEKVTGSSPRGYFNDFRNSSRARVQGLKEAIGVETASTVFNPKYISEMLKGEASAMDRFAETFRNTYGWNAMKPDAIDKHIWDGYYDVYVKDKYDLGVRRTFSEKNPYALQEMTAVMLESARKGLWKASDEQIGEVAQLHAELVGAYSAGCSGFICDNALLKEFISSKADPQTAAAYEKAVSQAREVTIQDSKDRLVLEKDKTLSKEQKTASDEAAGEKSFTTLWILAGLVLAVGAWIIIRSRKK